MFKLLTKTLALFLCFMSMVCVGQAQQKLLDSLLNINNTYLKKDTTKILLLNRISRTYFTTRSNADAYNYVQQAYTIAESLQNKKFIGASALLLSNVLWQQDKVAEVIKYDEQALAIFKDLKDNWYVSAAYLNLGNDYKKQNNYNKALEYYLKSNETVKLLKEPVQEIQSLLQIASTYLDLNNNDKALEYNFIALKIADKYNDKHGQGSSYFNIANLQYNLYNFKEAISYYQKALEIKHQLHETRTEMIILYDLGSANLELKDLKAAADCYNKSLLLAKSLNKSIEIGCLEGLGNIYLKQGKVADAVIVFEDAIVKRKQVGDQKLLAYGYITLNNAYVAAGKFTLAEKALDDARQIFDKLKIASGERDLLEGYADLYTASHDYNKALSNYKKFVSLRDSLVNIDVKNQVVKKEMQYTFDKKESEYQLNAAVSAKNLAQQRSLALQQHQQLLMEQQKLILSNKEKSLQRITYLSRQAQLENEKKLQASQLQKSKLKATLDKQVSGAQLFKQGEEIKSASRQRRLLLIMLLGALVITLLIFYNQLKVKKLNKVIIAQKQDLEHINSVKDRMFGIVSHDMRAPVNTLVAFNHLLEEEDLSPEKMKLYAKEIKKTLNHTSVLMENLLNWSSSQMQGYKPQLEKNSLKGISDNAINSVTDRALQKKIRLQNNIPSGIMVYADSNMTELIMRNILANAIKYTPQHGLIELNAEQVNNKTTFFISDTGIGMNPDQLMHFNSDKYDYTNTSKPGTDLEKGSGLGLVLCKTFTAIMNGTIFVKSEHGLGSTFYITLPSVG